MESSDQRPAGEQQPADETAAVPTSPARPREKTKIMDLARYKVGQRVFWIVFRAEQSPEFERAEDWMKQEHPWVLWRHKIMPWSVPMKPPRIHPADTMAIMLLCSQKPRIEPFRVVEVERSSNTGMFRYTGPKGMVMPESMLFPTKKAARKEIARIKKMFAAWMSTWESQDNTNRPATD